MRRLLAWLAIGLVILTLLVPIAALTFSVQVSGTSMDPTLKEGDRLLVDFIGRDRIKRFDLVEAKPGEGSPTLVKRVVGMPGDRVAVARTTGDAPRVFVRPAGGDEVFEVANPTWAGQVGDRTLPCCTTDGKSGPARAWATVPDGHYWLLGDNWGGSDDSRVFGFVPADQVAGRLNFRILPLSDFGEVPSATELVSSADQ
ncbi:signal peptidase I [Nocardioides speluncae]|uniref:signal peptidase I n=1 Tax=Nocardioides speluncae TaxID=2670337 RepID=UPI00137A0433|nr:signal peptidase I [Nocardioides speluncae]